MPAQRGQIRSREVEKTGEFSFTLKANRKDGQASEPHGSSKNTRHDGFERVAGWNDVDRLFLSPFGRIIDFVTRSIVALVSEVRCRQSGPCRQRVGVAWKTIAAFRQREERKVLSNEC